MIKKSSFILLELILLSSFGNNILGNRQNPLAHAPPIDHIGNPHRMYSRKDGNAPSIPAPQAVTNGLKSFFSVFWDNLTK